MKLKKFKAATTRLELKRKLLYFSFCSRIFVLLVSFASNKIIPDHDAGVFTFPEPIVQKSWIDHYTESFLGGLVRWDGQYFIHIAHYGYTYENTLAFFPFFPIVTRILAQCLDFFISLVANHFSTVMIASVLVNLFFFVKATETLFELSCQVLLDDKLAYISALFFCLNPASIFFTAPYSESCFAFFTFTGMLFYVNNKELLSSVVFGISGCARSNGVINFGFIAHKCLKNILDCMNSKNKMLSVLYYLCFELIKLAAYAVIFIVPFTMFQTYAHFVFCLGDEFDVPKLIKEFGASKGFVLPGSESSLWCNFSVPFSYFYVQKHYWNVGFLEYYELKQIPNFLLAFPMVYLVLSQTFTFMIKNKSHLISLGFSKIEFVKHQGRNLRPEFLVFVVHAMFLTLFCVFCIHIQVTTRMLASSSPVVYWFVALSYKTLSETSQQSIMSRLDRLQKAAKYSYIETQSNLDSFWKSYIISDKPADRYSHFVRMYFYLYFFVGTCLFSNFYPWT